jgi:nitroreductase
MHFLELAKKRYATRNFLPTPVSDADLALILEAARVAPTAKNLQPQRLLVIRSEAGRQRLAKAARVHGAPLAIITCAEHGVSWKRPGDGKDHADIDVSIVQDHMMMQATDLGLATLWVCWFDPAILRKEFNIPASVEPVSILAVGYEGGTPKPFDRHDSTRLPLSDLVVWDGF